ncbi:MAG: hypothetical protein NVSMB22_27290 [Chloroflexota bacterium]
MDEPSNRASDTRATSRGLGLAASIGAEVSKRAAVAVQEAGYQSFWLNNPPGSDALQTLGGVAQVARTIWLGVGIIPLSDQAPETIMHRTTAYGLPIDRFYLGIGSGSGPDGVQRVAAGLRVMRAHLQCRLVVAALGPAMCRLAGAEADAVLLNWLTPEFAVRSVAWVREGADRAGRPLPRIMTYVRVALGDEAMMRLREEAANYAAIPHYANHFARMSASAMETTVTGRTEDSIQQGLAAWNGVVDEVVVRAIPAHNTAEDVLTVVEAARPEHAATP